MNWLLWFGLIVAIWSTTRLLIKDEFPPVRVTRDWFVATFGVRDERTGELVGGRPGWGVVGYSIAYIWTCPWCMSVWVGIALWLFADYALGFSVSLPWLLIAAGRVLTGLAGMLEARIDQNYEEAEVRLGR